MLFTKKSIIKLIFVTLISTIFSFELSIGMSSKEKITSKEDPARTLWQSMPEFKLSEKYLHEEKLRDAYHESGHALVAALNNVKIKELSLIKNGYNQGETKLIGINQIEHNIMIALAGYLAEEIIFGTVGRGCFEDLDEAASSSICMAPGKYINPEKLTPAQLLKKFLSETRALLKENIKCLHALALAAEEQKKLSGDEIAAIISKFKK